MSWTEVASSWLGTENSCSGKSYPQTLINHSYQSNNKL